MNKFTFDDSGGNQIRKTNRRYGLLSFCILFLALLFLPIQMKGQGGEYVPLVVLSGFTDDVIAEQSPAIDYSTNAVDNPNATTPNGGYAFVVSGYPGATGGLPTNGLFTSATTPDLTFQLGDYNGNNSLRIAGGGTSLSGTLEFQNQESALKIYILTTSGSGVSTFTGVITFTDDSTQAITTQTVADWYGGTPVALYVNGRVNRGNNAVENPTNNPRLYQIAIDIDAANQNKLIKEITFTNTSSGSFLNIFGVSAEIIPDCPKPTSLSANTTFTEAELFWTSDGSLFDIEWGVSGFTPTGNPNDATTTGVGNLFELTGLIAETSYQYYVRQDCGTDGVSNWAGPFTFYTGYCEVTSTSIAYGIANFTTTGGVININNTSGGGSYSNYTTQYVAQFEGDDDVQFTITSANGTAGMGVWIDWNNDMDFNDPGEHIYNSGAYVASGSGAITIPPGTPVGDYRMRVVANWLNTNPTPCGDLGNPLYGEAEDYTFSVIEVPDCMPPSGLNAVPISLTDVTLSWNSAGTLFDVEWGPSGFTLGNGFQITGLTTTTTDLTVTIDTPYQFYVRQDCTADDDGYSLWAGPFNFQTGYCIPSSTNSGDHISSFVTTGGIPYNITNTGSGASVGGYGNFTSMSVSHYETGSVDFTLTAGGDPMSVNIWIDWNSNGTFEESEKVYASGGPGATVTGSFSVPFGTPLGDYRMRVRGQWNNTNPAPCGNIAWGEAEDYTFTVITPPDCAPPSGLTATPTSLTEILLGWSSDGSLFDVEWGPSGFTLGDGAQILGVTTTSTNISVIIDTPYQFYVRQDCTADDDGYSLWAGPFSFQTGYCVPSSTNSGDHISSFVTTGGIPYNITNTGSGASTGGYGNFTSMSVSHYETGSVDFTLTAGGDPMSVNIWIDWNSNGIFEESEKVYASGGPGATVTGSFSVPFGTPLGDYRMRVRGQWNNTNPAPCGNIAWGEAEDYTFSVIEVPDCMPPSGLGTAGVTFDSAILSWISDGTAFDVEYGLSGFTPTGNPNDATTTGVGNLFELTGLIAETSYQYYVRQDCTADDDGYSLWAGPYTFYTGYCEVTSTSINYGVSNFTTTGGVININNSSGGGSYSNYTTQYVAQFDGGENVSFTITSANGTAGMGVWIDWNNDMDFNDPGEHIYNSGAYVASGSGAITIPPGTPVGDYRMRVVANWLNTNPTPCGDLGNPLYGEAEDYTFSVIEVPDCMPPSGLNAVPISLTDVTLSWNSAGTLFDVEWGPSGFTLGNGFQITGLTTTTTDLTVTIDTPYQFYVRQDCTADDDGYSLWAGPFNFQTGYCIPSSTNSGDHISSFVTTGGIPYNITNTGSGASIGGYGNFTSMSVSHYETGSVDFTLTAGGDPMSVNIWIDWNSNGIFEESEKVYASGGPGATVTGSFSVPFGTPLGDYRMRVRGQWNNTNPAPCGNIAWGEAEDYTFTVIDPPSCLPPFNPTAINISASSVSLSWQANGDSFDIEWGEQGFTPGTGTLISGVGNPYVLGGLIGGTTYQFYVRQDCGEDDGYSMWNGPTTFTPGVFEGSIPTLLNTSPQVEDIACATSFAIDVPEGQFLAGLTVQYVMTSASPALDSHQRSVLYSSTLGMGETAVALPPNPQNYPGVVYYSRSVNFANGATGTIEFELKAWRTEGGSGCGTALVYVEDGSWVLNATFEDIPTCPNPPASLAYTNITEDSVDLIWTSEEDGTFQVKWGAVGFNVETAGTVISDIEAYSYTLSGLDSSIPYDFYVRRDCSDDDQEDFGEWVGPVRFNSGHCIPYATQGFYFTLFNTTNAVENVTYSNPGPALGTGYVNTDMIITESAGETFNFTSNYVGGASGLKIWVDWNNNFVFEDDEQVYFLASTNGNKSGAITVPAGTEPGDYRMRARAQQGATANPNACGLIVQGEAIDFTLRVPCDVIDAPTGDAVQYFVAGDTLAHLDVTGTGIVWFADEDLENELEETELLVHGTTYYAISTVGDCQSEALAVTAEDMCFDFAAPVGDPVQQFTAGTGATLADLDVTGTGLVWYADEDLTDMLDENTPLVNGTTYYVVSTSEDCQSEALAIEVEEVSSTSDFNSFGFTYYPNPVSELLYLSANTPISDVTVINMLGQQVNVSANHDNTRLDMSGLPAGNYLMKVTIEGVSKILKIVKK